MKHYIISVIVLLYALPAVAEVTLQGRVVPPEGVEPGSLSVTLFHEAPTEVEEESLRRDTIRVNERGEFELRAEPIESTQIEVTGPGVRRARFPWPADLAGDETRRAVFDLEPGFAIQGSLRDLETLQPLGGVAIGPVSPGPDASRSTMEKSFPFFETGSGDGTFTVEGLAGETSWILPFRLEGYERQVLRMQPGLDMTISLRRGGASLSGTLVGSRSLQPQGLRTVLLQGGPRDFHIVRRTTAEGAWSFDGLPAGEYLIAAWSQEKGTGPVQSHMVVQDGAIEGITLLYPEGIRITGMLADGETGDAVSNAEVVIGELRAMSDPEGHFEVYPVEAPWPKEISVLHPEFAFFGEDQNSEAYPFDGTDGSDLDTGTLLLRRKRVLEITVEKREESDEPTGGIAEVFGPFEGMKENVQRTRISGDYGAIPIQYAGTRAVVLRGTDDLVSDLQFVSTGLRETTTTVTLKLDVGGKLEGALTYEGEGVDPVAPRFEVVIKGEHSEGRETFVLRESDPASNGTFNIPALPPGEYVLRLERDGGEPWIQERIEVKRGETTEFVRAIPRGVPVAGFVLNSSEEPLREVTVSAYGRDPLGGSVHLKDVSDAEGRFEFDGFGGETIELLTASHAVHGEGELRTVPIPDEDIKLVLSAPEGIRVTIPEGSPVANTGEAILLVARERPVRGGVSQWFYEMDSRESFAGTTEAVLRPHATGRTRIAAGANSTWTVSDAFDWVQGGEEKSISLNPAATARLVCMVENISSDELSDLEVILLNTALPESMARTEFEVSRIEGNELWFDSIPAGEYLLMAYAPDGETTAAGNIDVGENQTVRTSLKMESPNVDLVGRIVKGDEGLEGVRVILREGDIPEPPVLFEAVSSADGMFTFYPLTENRRYILTAEYETGESTWPFVAEPNEDGIAVREFVIVDAMEVELAFPDSLRNRVLQPGPPILLQGPQGTETRMLPTPLENFRVQLTPGTWSVYHGEEGIGTVTIDRNTRVATLSPL